MLFMFEPSVYSSRRKALASSFARGGADADILLFPGNHESPMNYEDNGYRFRQDSSFLYYFGLSEPGMAATIDPSSGAATLYADEASVDMMVWTGPVPGLASQAASSGIESVRPRGELRAACAGKRVAYLPPYRADTVIELSRLLDSGLDSVRDGRSLPLIRAVIAQREIKEDREVEAITRAVDTSVDMHRAVIAAAKPGMSESALMAIAYREALAAGGMPSFPPIATTRGAVLHNHSYSRVLADGGMFLLDAGAETPDAYAGDLTSTFPIAPRFDGRQAALYEIVLRAGAAAVREAKPGVPYKEAHLAAARAIAGGLCDLGLMKGDPDEAVAAGAHALFFPHGVGHQMGLDVHDCEALGEINVGYDGEEKSREFGLKSLRMAKALKPGMVLTVEPGVYFIEGLIALWRAERRHERYIDYAKLGPWLDAGGYRNEEDWLVVDTGMRRLGKAFDKSLKAMEGYRGA